MRCVLVAAMAVQLLLSAVSPASDAISMAEQRASMRDAVKLPPRRADINDMPEEDSWTTEDGSDEVITHSMDARGEFEDDASTIQSWTSSDESLDDMPDSSTGALR